MAEYTYKDVIIDPDDPRVEIGAKYYRADYPKKVLFLANNEEDYVGTLEEIDTESPETPFVVRTGGAHAPWACIIRKKEPEKKYVPFDLSKEEDRVKLRGAWVRPKDCYPNVDHLIRGISNSTVWFGDSYLTALELLNEYEFINGDPCGILKGVTDD